MKSLRSILGGLLATLTFHSASAGSGTNPNEGIWDDRWMGGYGDWLPLVLAVVVCLLVWKARRKQRK